MWVSWERIDRGWTPPIEIGPDRPAPLHGAELNRLKRLYRRAARLHHPDMGGTSERMAEVNAAYVKQDLAALEQLVDGHSVE